MAETLTIPKGINVTIQGDLSVRGTRPTIPRSRMVQDDNQVFPTDLRGWCVHDGDGGLLPATSAADDLGYVDGTFGTGVPSIDTYDLASAGAVTLYARKRLIVPIEYQAGQTILIRAHAGQTDALADSSATVDFSAYKSDKDGTVSSDGDLVSTAAQSANSATFADYDFTLDGSALSPGDEIDVRVAVAVNDAATIGSTVVFRIGSIALVCDCKG